jgi:hypothetical protein
MNAHRTLAVALLPGMMALLGCDKDQSSSSSAAPSAAMSASAAPSAPSASASSSPEALASAAAAASAAAFAAKGASRRHVGLAGVLLRGAYDLDLTPDQRAKVDGAEDALYADAASTPWAALKSFHTDLVAGIRAGKLDTAKLSSDYAAIDKAVQAGQSREADALNDLHGALDAGQRQQLVDRVKAKRAARERPIETAPDGGAVDFAKRRLERLTLELTLDDAQQKSVGALLARDTTLTSAAITARRDAVHKRVDALYTAFMSDTFDAKKLNMAPEGKSLHEGPEHTAAFVAGILPVLHADQREKLALRNERMANRPMRNFDDFEYGFGASGAEEDMRMMPRGR